MSVRSTLSALATCLLGSSAAMGQVSYNGWDLGPDYGAMINQGMANMNNIVNQANQRAEQSVQWMMNQPQCRAAYQQHQQQGGRLSYRDFASQFAATAGGSAEGKARYFASEQANQAKERQAYQNLLQAQQERARAIQAWQQGYANIQNERGNLLMGNSTYTDHNGTQHVLPHIQSGTTWHNPNTGYNYRMDNQGNYYMQMPNGWWYNMRAGW